MSLRTRLLLWYTVTFAAGLLLFAVLIWMGVRHTLSADLDQWLNAQAEALDRFLKNELPSPDEAGVLEESREFCTALPAGSGLQVLDPAGRVLLSRPASREAIAHSVGHVIRGNFAGMQVRVTARELSIHGLRFRYALWRSTQGEDEELQRLSRLLMTLAPVLLLLSAAGGWWLSSRALAPVDEITAAARTVSLQEMSARLPMPRHEDELRRLSEAWNEMLERLQDSARRLNRFTANASHELRTPLAVMRTTAELALRHERSGAEYREALEGIRASSEEMTGLIENLLELARADAGQIPLSRVRQDVRALIADVTGQVRPLAAAKAVRIEEACDGGLAVEGDRGQLRRLLDGGTLGALKFTPEGGRVGIQARRESAACVVEVSDTGCGISAGDLPRIFDRFYQADTARSQGGSGLGLALAQWIVSSHGGTIGAESQPGQGTRITIRLPALAG
jgi:heavy metal sensor kinase